MTHNSFASKLVTLGKSQTAAVFVLSFLIIALKNSLNEVIYPILPAEDGRFLFQIFYNDHEFKSVFRLYSGYISIFPNLLAYCLTFLPVKIIPSSFAFISLCITAAAYSLFYRITDKVYHDKIFAAYVVIVISALPLGNFWLVGALAYQSWNFTVILFLLSLLPMPQKTGCRILYALLINLLIWSHPLSLLMIPLWLLNFAKSRGNRTECILFCGSALLYGFAGMVPGEIIFPDWINIFKIFMIRVVGEALIGPQNRMLWYEAGNELVFWFLFFLSLSAIALLFYFSRNAKNGEEKKTLAALTYFLCATFAISIVTRITSRNLAEEFLAAEWGTQYVYIPKMLFVAILLLVSHHVLKSFVWFRFILIALTAIAFWTNSSGNAVYKTRIDNGKKVLEFVDILSNNGILCEEGAERYITLKKGNISTEKFPGNFNIRIDICKKQP